LRIDARISGLRSFILRSSVLPSVASRQAGTLSNKFQSSRVILTGARAVTA
jgi:hypothetical protein